MRKVVRTLLMSGRKVPPAGWPALATLTVLFVGGLLPHPAAAQASPQTPVTRIRTKQPLSPEILAMHARAKRPVATAPTTSLELAATATALASTTFNSEQGLGPGPIGPGPGCNLFPAPASHRRHSPSIVLWTTTFGQQS
jgi:hypothetical protein